jgi:sulfopropanediol 3-dehydrogenase
MKQIIKPGVLGVDRRKADPQVQQTVAGIIEQIASEGDEALRRLSNQFDRWDRANYRLSQLEISRILESIPLTAKQDIEFAQKQIRNFAQAQRSAIQDIEVETLPGVRLGHKWGTLSRPRDECGVWRQSDRHQPHIADGQSSSLHRRALGWQVPENGHLSAVYARCQRRDRRLLFQAL